MEFLRCLSGKISPKGADIPLAEKPANIEGLPNRQLYVSQRILDNKSLVNCTITSLTRGPYFLWRSLRARWYCSFPWLPGTRYWKPFISFTMSRKAKIFCWKVLTKLWAIHCIEGPLPEEHESIYRMFFLTGPPYFFTNRHLANHSCCSMNFFIERGHLVCIEKGVGAVKTPYRICVKSEYVPADKSLRWVVLVDLKSTLSAFSLSLSKFPILGLQSPYKQNFHFHCLNYLSWACNHHINRISTFTF